MGSGRWDGAPVRSVTWLKKGTLLGAIPFSSSGRVLQRQRSTSEHELPEVDVSSVPLLKMVKKGINKQNDTHKGDKVELKMVRKGINKHNDNHKGNKVEDDVESAKQPSSSLREGPASTERETHAPMSIQLTRAQWRKLAILAFGSLVNNVTYSLLAPFFPTVARERGVSQWHVGLVFGVFALAAFATAPYAGTALAQQRCGRLNMMVFGMLLNAVFTAAFGCLEYVDADLSSEYGNVLYLTLAYSSRALAGVGCGLTDTALYALIADSFKGHAHLPALMGSMESVCGLGFVAGPALGGLLFDQTSFSLTMILPSALLAVYVWVPLCVLRVPVQQRREPGGGGDNNKAGGGHGETKRLVVIVGEDPDGTEDDDLSHEGPGRGGVKMSHLFRSFRFVSVCWSGVLANLQFGYLEATYADLADHPGSATRVGVLFAIMAGVYCLLTSPVGMICTRVGLHNCLALGFCIVSSGYVMLVPPASWGRWFHELPGREHAAMALNGLGAAFSYVPIYPALLRATRREHVEGISDLVAGVTGSSFQLGNFLGPVLAVR